MPITFHNRYNFHDTHLTLVLLRRVLSDTGKIVLQNSAYRNAVNSGNNYIPIIILLPSVIVNIGRKYYLMSCVVYIQATPSSVTNW